MDSWWKTPSLDGYLAKIIEKLWSGNIVLAFMPENTPMDFFPELKERCKKNDIKDFSVIDFGRVEALQPLEVLHNYFELNETEKFVPKRVNAIFDNVKKSVDRLMVFKNVSGIERQILLAFMDDLFHYNKSIEANNRHKILVLIENGSLFPSDFKLEPFVAKEVFSQKIDKLTQLNSLKYHIKYKNGHMAELYESIIISLAKYDCALTERLVECKSLLDDYKQVLWDFATERGWKDIPYKTKGALSENETWHRWAKGILDFESENIIIHSAYLQIHGQEKEVNMRLWKAGVEVLLPLIEEMRNKIVSSDKIEFTQPAFLINPKELKNDKSEFEIGEIVYCINNRLINIKGPDNNKKKRIKDFIRLCRDIRNDISHLKIPESDKIKNFFTELNSIDDILL